MMHRRIRHSAAAIVALAVLAGCGTTTVDESGGDDPAEQLSEAELTGGEGRELTDEDTSQLDTGVIVDPEAPATTIPIEGSAADLLPDIGIDMSRLSSVTVPGDAAHQRSPGSGDDDPPVEASVARTAAVQQGPPAP